MIQNIIGGPKIEPEIMDQAEVSLGEYFLKVTKPFWNKISMIDAESGQRLTYRELFEKSYRIASLFYQMKCSRGEVIAIIAENCLEFPCIMMAGFHTGIICTCINPLYSLDELRHAFSISKPKMVFASNSTHAKVQKVQAEFDFIQTIFNIEANDYKSACQNLNKIHSVEDFTAKNKEGKTEDVATLLYSSGSTGLSKGVKVSHKNYIFLMEFYKKNENLRFPENSVASALLPMSHCYGLFTILMGLTQGHTSIIFKQYSKATFLNYLNKYEINILYLVPSIVIHLLKDPAVLRYDLSCVKCITCAGANLNKDTEQAIKQRLPPCKFIQFYGMTETTGACIVPSTKVKPETVGRLMPGMKAKIVDLNNGKSLGPHQLGELCLKGILLMNGYCMPEKYQNLGVDEDGWLHSGDVAYYDDDSDFYIVDRIKELIKYKSYQVPPTEIETCLLKLGAIEEVGVVGVPDEEAGELPRAYVVKKKDYDNLTEADILKHVEENLSAPKKLRGGVIFVDEIPKTATGKLNRLELKKWVSSNCENIPLN